MAAQNQFVFRFLLHGRTEDGKERGVLITPNICITRSRSQPDKMKVLIDCDSGSYFDHRYYTDGNKRIYVQRVLAARLELAVDDPRIGDCKPLVDEMHFLLRDLTGFTVHHFVVVNILPPEVSLD